MRRTATLAILLSLSLLPSLSIAQDKEHAVEYEIAGLRPGKDTIEKAYHRFGKNRQSDALSRLGSAVWLDVCNRQMLTVAFDTDGMIRDVTMQYGWASIVDCDLKSYSRSVRSRTGGTRRGLVLQDRCDLIQQIYGSPQSERQSIDDNKELNSFLYRFNRGETLLTLEVTCDSASKQVVTIRLTASGLTKT